MRADIFDRPLQLGGIDGLSVLAVAQVAVNHQVDRVTDRANRAVAKDHLKASRVGTAEDEAYFWTMETNFDSEKAIKFG